MTSSPQQFQVDLRGVVDLLSRHIYSSPRVYLRELLQNARDAITARQALDGGGGSIRITPIAPASTEFVLRDDGIGLTADEVAELLATVGRSSKRDIFDLPRQDFLGQFGIGLLSCFMVADEIVIRSQSATGAPAVEWVGKTDGTFTVRELAEPLAVGTSVHLSPRAGQDELLRSATVRTLAETFGEFLPYRIAIDLPGGGDDVVNHEPPFLGATEHPERAAEYGTTLLGTQPFDMIDLSAPATGSRGIGYVLPCMPPPSARQTSRVYLNRMLLGERIPDLLPEWAFFVRAVVDSTGMHPTASRESLVEDDALEETREAFGQAIRRWVLDLGLTQPHRLQQFVAIHEVSLKSLVRHDEELAQFIVRWLTVETTHGRMAIGDMVQRFGRVRYAETVDEYHQVASISDASSVLVNGGYLYDADIVRMLPALYPAVLVERVDVVSEFERLDPPPLDDRDATVALEARASAVLADVDTTVIVRTLDRQSLPALYVADPEVLRKIDRTRAQGISGSLWSGVLGKLDEITSSMRSDDTDLSARLCLNWGNKTVRTLTRVTDDAVFSRTVQLLYVQALLAGHRPLSERDRSLMTTALSDLIALSAGEFEPDFLPPLENGDA